MHSSELYAQAVVTPVIPAWHTFEMINMSHIRQMRGLSQMQLAERVGANQATISKIEKGIGNPTLSMITRIAKALNVHPSELFGMEPLKQRALEAIDHIKDPSRKDAAIIVLESMADK